MLGSIIPYFGFTQFTPSLPEFYWNVYSAEQRIKHICYELCKLAKYDEYIAEQLNLDRETIDKLMEQFEDFIDGGYEKYYEAQIQAWLEAHMEEIISNAIKMVFFGLNQDGYFVAYIPDSWSEIIFDTGMIYSEDSYGCLMLKWDGENGGVTDTENLYRQLAIRVARTEHTLYTPVEEGGE